MKRLVVAFVFIFIMSKAFVCDAQNSDSVEVNRSPKTSVWGFADIYFGYNFNQPPSRIGGELITGGNFLYSHNRHNEVNLNNGVVGMDYLHNNVRGVLALHTGTYPTYNYAHEPVMYRFIYEAYAGYQPIKGLWIDAGIFTSHIGAESALSIDDLTLTRSMMAENTPYYQTGVRAIYDVNKTLSFGGLVLNGWQNIADYNNNKALGTQIQIKPTRNILINYSTFYGKEAGAYEQTAGVSNTDSLSTRRFFNNLYCIATLNKVALSCSFDIGIQKKRNASGNYLWYNPNVIVSYLCSGNISVVARGEYFNDKNGVIISTGTPNGFQTFTGSLGMNFKFASNLCWRIEGKLFQSKDKIFLHKDIPSNQSIQIVSSVAIKL
jgi:hypothetical protein